MIVAIALDGPASDAMLAKVEPYGWYDPATARVKAHVEDA